MHVPIEAVVIFVIVGTPLLAIALAWGVRRGPRG
jgi:hypothetical protein